MNIAAAAHRHEMKKWKSSTVRQVCGSIWFRAYCRSRDELVEHVKDCRTARCHEIDRSMTRKEIEQRACPEGWRLAEEYYNARHNLSVNDVEADRNRYRAAMAFRLGNIVVVKKPVLIMG